MLKLNSKYRASVPKCTADVRLFPLVPKVLFLADFTDAQYFKLKKENEQ